MRWIADRYDPNDGFSILSKTEEKLTEVRVEYPGILTDKRWAELAGASVKSVRRFRKKHSELLGPCARYAAQKYFLEIWGSLIRRAMDDKDIKGKELFLKCMRVLKEETDPRILAIFNIGGSDKEEKRFLTDQEIDVWLGNKPVKQIEGGK